MDALDMEAMETVLAPGEGSRSASGMSGSKMQRAVQCAGSTVLPSVGDFEMGAPAEQGHAIHKFFTAAAKVGRETALELIPAEYVEICGAFDLDKIPTVDAERYSHEVAFAYDALSDASRVIGYDIGRAYGDLADGEIGLSLDVVGLTDDEDGVVVVDWKSGRVAVAPPKTNWQLKTGAVAAARRFNRRYAHVAIAYTQPGTKPTTEWATFDAFELDEAADQLRELVIRRGQLAKSFQQRGYAGLGNSLVRGPECRYCPSAPFCPATTSHIRAVLGDPLAFQRQIVPLITSAQLGQAKAMHSQLKGLVESLDDQIKECAKQTPAIMPSGRFYGETQQRDDELDGQITFKVLNEWLPTLFLNEPDEGKRVSRADGLARIAVHAETSKAAIERALDEIAPRGARASMVREALARIDFAGGIKKGVKTVVKEYSGAPRVIRLPASGDNK